MQKSIRSRISLLKSFSFGLHSRRCKRGWTRRAALAALCGLILSASAFALERAASPSTSASHTPGITLVPGKDGGHVRFEIKGKEVAILDETGLHVRGDINYGAKLSNYGKKGFDAHAATSREQAHAE